MDDQKSVNGGGYSPKILGRGIDPSASLSPSPFYRFSKTEKCELHISLHSKSIEFAILNRLEFFQLAFESGGGQQLNLGGTRLPQRRIAPEQLKIQD